MAIAVVRLSIFTIRSFLVFSPATLNLETVNLNLSVRWLTEDYSLAIFSLLSLPTTFRLEIVNLNISVRRLTNDSQTRNRASKNSRTQLFLTQHDNLSIIER